MALDVVALDVVSFDPVGAMMSSVIFMLIFIAPNIYYNLTLLHLACNINLVYLVYLVFKHDKGALFCTRSTRWTDVLNTCTMKIYEIYNTAENIGPAPKGVCSKPMSSLPASWVSSCKSQGKMKRTGNRNEKVGGKTMKVSGKRIKGKKYGGPLPDYSK